MNQWLKNSLKCGDKQSTVKSTFRMMYVGSECTHRMCRPCAEKTLISQKWPSKEIFKNRKFKAEYFKPDVTGQFHCVLKMYLKE